MLLQASFYHLPLRVLPAIQAVEGGYPGLVHMNVDGSADLGVMQINTRWVQPIADAVHVPPEAVRQRLINDPCVNITAAAGILNVYLTEAHGDLMRAIGFYHSHTTPLSLHYQGQVTAKAMSLFGLGAR
jgi:hypothetical protein